MNEEISPESFTMTVIKMPDGTYKHIVERKYAHIALTWWEHIRTHLSRGMDIADSQEIDVPGKFGTTFRFRLSPDMFRNESTIVDKPRKSGKSWFYKILPSTLWK